MQGQDFVNSPAFISALDDFNAFEQNPAFKNVFRIILSDGYIGKLLGFGAWNYKAQGLTDEIVRLYAVDKSICAYMMESIAYGLGYLTGPPTYSPTTNNPSKPATSAPKPSGLNKSHKDFTKMDEDAISLYIRDSQNYLDQIIEIKGNWEEELGARFKINSHYTVSTNGWNCIQFRIEIDGRISFPKCSYIEFNVVLYDETGKIVGRNYVTYWKKRAKSFEVLETLSIDHTEYRTISNIAKAVFYWTHD